MIANVRRGSSYALLFKGLVATFAALAAASSFAAIELPEGALADSGTVAGDHIVVVPA